MPLDPTLQEFPVTVTSSSSFLIIFSILFPVLFCCCLFLFPIFIICYCRTQIEKISILFQLCTCTLFIHNRTIICYYYENFLRIVLQLSQNMSVPARMFPSRAERVRQWMLFSRQWHVIDADHQDVWKLGRKVAKYLLGWWKPIFHPHTDTGDHVVVINCKEASMHGFDWKHTHYFYDRLFPKSKADIPAYQIHEYDPCRIVWMCSARELLNLNRNRIPQRICLERLHVLPDDEMPDFLRNNINSQLRQVQEVPKKSTDYTAEERAAFPKLFRPGKKFLKEWKDPIEPEKWHPHSQLIRGEESWDRYY